MSLVYPSRRDLENDAALLFMAYQPDVTWLGQNSVAAAFLRVCATLAEIGVYDAVQILRRVSLLSAEGDDQVALLAEHGTALLPGTRAQVLVVLRPARARVEAITAVGPLDKLEVDDSSGFSVGMSLRIRNTDGTTTEAATILGVATGTGPHGLDELSVATLINSYTPSTTADDVVVLARITVPAGTALQTSSGVSLVTLVAKTTGERNSILDGASTAVSLADLVVAEATIVGVAGNVTPYDVTNLTVPVAGILSAFNPVAGVGGADVEPAPDARVRTIALPGAANQLTKDWIEASARAGDSSVLRVVKLTSSGVNTVTVGVLSTSGGILSDAQKVALALYLEQRARCETLIEILDVTMTSVAITATFTLVPGYILRDVWIDACSRVADYLDFRSWAFGTDVDAGGLYDLVRTTPGVLSIDPDDFTPGSDVAVADTSLPRLTSITMTDLTTGDVVGGDLEQAY